MPSVPVPVWVNATLAASVKLRQAGDADMTTWTAQDLRRFLAGVRDHRLYAAWHLLSNTGL